MVIDWEMVIKLSEYGMSCNKGIELPGIKWKMQGTLVLTDINKISIDNMAYIYKKITST